jgi:1-acyl-sn-glycerol-3-phosphate acyltransferase
MTYRLVRVVLIIVTRAFWRLRVTGVELLPSGPFVLVGNHESALDGFMVGAAIPRRVYFLAKDDLWRIRPVGMILTSLGGIPVGRGRGDRGAIERAEQALRAGKIVGVFPQGTVFGGEGRVWHRGAARLALVTGVPIVPLCIVDAERALRPVRRRLGFPIVRVLVGRPIEVEPVKPTIAAARELTGRVRQEVEALRLEYGAPLPAPER